ncbi:hypothetical protein Tco_0709088, partial [Tanacetum coccineum]
DCCFLLPEETAAPYLLRRLLLLTFWVDCCFLPPEETAAPYLLRRLLLLTSRGDCCSLPPEETAAPYLLRRYYSLVIASKPEVAFVTPAIPVDRSNMEWFWLRNIRS